MIQQRRGLTAHGVAVRIAVGLLWAYYLLYSVVAPPVVTDARKAVAALNWVVAEMEDRYRRMASMSVRNIDVFNKRVRNARRRVETASACSPGLEAQEFRAFQGIIRRDGKSRD